MSQLLDDPTVDRNQFAETINFLFEHSLLLIDKLYANRPYRSFSAIIDYAEHLCLTEMPWEDRLQVINAHPRLGAPKEQLSQQSSKEQGYTSTDTTVTTQMTTNDAEVNSQLQRLNEEYEKKFGFKFVIFVNGRSRREIIPLIEERIQRQRLDVTETERQQELLVGLREMMAIARDRLSKRSH